MGDKQRRSTAHPLDVYSFVNYVTYALYPPLYIAGPIMTFNDFFWQVSVYIINGVVEMKHSFLDAKSTENIKTYRNRILCALPSVPFDDGDPSAFHVHCCD
jgi:D-alanyl-lipoteichoic acid acyltransferase DltB (MBOAT superfamily)